MHTWNSMQLDNVQNAPLHLQLDVLLASEAAWTLSDFQLPGTSHTAYPCSILGFSSPQE